MIFQLENADLSWLYEWGSIITIGIFVVVIVIIAKIKSLFPGTNIVKKWTILQVLVIVFIGAYILDWILLFYPESELQGEILYIVNYANRGLLRIAVGVFILLAIWLIYNTYKIILLGKK